MTPDKRDEEHAERLDRGQPTAAADASRRRSRSAAADAPATERSRRRPTAESTPEPTLSPTAELEAEAEAGGAEAEAEAEAKPRRRSRRLTRAKRRAAVARLSRARGEETPPLSREAADVARRPRRGAVRGDPTASRRRSCAPRPSTCARSARKARLVCDHIRGKSVEEARAILALTPRAIARDWSKLLESAVANAEHNHELVGEDLYVKAVHADEGPTIKRFRPRAMGRATQIRKRTSHLTILLTPKD